MASVLESAGNNKAPVYTTQPTIRTISSGQTALTLGTTTDVSTFTQNSSERVNAGLFVTDDVLDVIFCSSTVVPIDGVVAECRRTANAGEAMLSLICGGTGRTVDWMVLGYV